MKMIVESFELITEGSVDLNDALTNLTGNEILTESGVLNLNDDGWSSEYVAIMTRNDACTSTHFRICEPTYNYTDHGTVEIMGYVPVWTRINPRKIKFRKFELIMLTLRSKSFDPESK